MWLKIHELPWRYRPQAKMKRLYALQLGSVLGIMLFLWGSTHLIIAGKMTHQASLNRNLTQELQKAHQSCPEISLWENAIGDLYDRRSIRAQLYQQPHTIALLDAIARLVPEGVYLTHLSRVEDQIAIVGRAGSHQQIALLMRQLTEFPGLASPQLSVVQSQGQSISDVIAFEVRATDKPKMSES